MCLRMREEARMANVEGEHGKEEGNEVSKEASHF